MAENKKSFILYADQISIFEALTDNEAGQLIKHIFKYVNDENPVCDNRIVAISFEPIKLQLKRDLVSWENKITKRGESGSLGNLKRWHKDLYNKVIAKELNVNEALEIANNRKVSHSDNSDRKPSQTVANITVTDNVNVNDNVIKIKARKLLFANSEYYDKAKFKEALKDWPQNKIDYYWQSLDAWSAEGNKKVDWIRTAKNWALRDENNGKTLFKSQEKPKFHFI